MGDRKKSTHEKQEKVRFVGRMGFFESLVIVYNNPWKQKRQYCGLVVRALFVIEASGLNLS